MHSYYSISTFNLLLLLILLVFIGQHEAVCANIIRPLNRFFPSRKKPLFNVLDVNGIGVPRITSVAQHTISQKLRIWSSGNIMVKQLNDKPYIVHPTTKKLYPPLSPDLATGVSAVKALGMTGKGVKIGIIDTGVDYTHPALGGGIGAGYKVEFGHDFVGDKYAETGKAVESNDPRDCQGHGTLVAGVIGAVTANFVGVAPEATLGAYRVAGCTPGGPVAEPIKKAFGRADADGMHIINISANTLDNREGFYAKLLEEYHRKNIIIIVSSGNIVEGMNLAWSSRLFGNSPHTVSVGSLDLRYDEQRYFTIAGKETIPVPYKSACTMNSLLINDLNLFTITPEMISCSLPFNVRGKAVLVASNKCNINVLLANAKKVGAGGVIIRQPINLLDNCPLPVIGLSEASFKTMVNLMEKQPNPTLQFSSDTMLAPDTRPILNDMRTFWGPSVELGLNPNVIAPGKIMFTTTAKDKGYKVADGTSFASPYVAGSAALFLQYHAKSNVIPRFPPSIFQALIQSTALPYMIPGTSLAGPVPQQGAGVIRIDRLLRTNDISVKELFIGLGDMPTVNEQAYSKSATITLLNQGKRGKLLSIRHLPAMSMRSFDDSGADLPSIELLDAHAEVGFAQSSNANSRNTPRSRATTFTPSMQVPLASKSSLSIDINFTIPPEITYKKRWVYSGYIVIDMAHVEGQAPSDNAIYIPYLGLNGNIKSFQYTIKSKSLSLLSKLRSYLLL